MSLTKTQPISFRDLFKQQPPKGSLIIVLKINLGNGRQQQLKVHELDVPHVLASEFVSTHNLNPKLQPLIVQQIFSHLQQILEQELSQIHQEHVEQLSPSVSQFSQTSYSNSGERLYKMGIIQKQRTTLRIKALKQRLQEEEKSQNTFTPKINQMSSMMASRSSRSEDSLSIARIQNLRQEKLNRDLQNCTFTPKVNPNSKRILQKRGKTSQDKFTELFLEAALRDQRKQDLTSEFYSKPSSTSTANPEEVVQRLVNSKKQTEEYLHQERIKQIQPIDQQTGQRLFRPKTGRAPITNRNQQGLPVGEYLYKKQTQKPVQVKQTPSVKVTKTQNRSEKLLVNVKIQNFYEIFQLLGPDQEGNLMGSDLLVHNLHPYIVKLLNPLFEEIKEVKMPLGFEDFVEAMTNLMETLTPAEKSIFYTRKKPLPEEPVSRSQQLPAESFNIYKRHLDKQRESQSKVEKIKQQIQNAELNECTFQPATTPYHRNKFKLY